MKKAILTIGFIIISFCIISKYNDIITLKVRENVSKVMKNENNIDIFFIGNSEMNWTLSPMYIWNKFGVVSYNRGVEQQSVSHGLSAIKEIYKYYKPKVVIVDILFLTYLYPNKPLTYRSIAVMHKNINKLIAYNDTISYIKALDNKTIVLDEWQNINTIAKFHNRWKELKQYDFADKDYLKGYFLNHGIYHFNAPNIDYKKEKEIPEPAMNIIREMVKIANQKNSIILFVRLPNANDSSDLTVNYFEKIAIQEGWDFIDLKKKWQELGIDYSRDFQSANHPNLFGSAKIMDNLIPAVMKKYGVESRKNDIRYKNWNIDYVKYSRDVNKKLLLTSIYFNDWVPLSQYDNYTMLISTNGDNVLNRLPQAMKDKFKTLGLTKYETDKGNMKYVAIIDDSKVFYEEVSDNRVAYKGRMKNIVNLLVSSENRKSTINVSGKPRSKNRYGINFVIYDKVNREIVDSIWVDPANFNQVRR